MKNGGTRKVLVGKISKAVYGTLLGGHGILQQTKRSPSQHGFQDERIQ